MQILDLMNFYWFAVRIVSSMCELLGTCVGCAVLLFAGFGKFYTFRGGSAEFFLDYLLCSYA